MNIRITTENTETRIAAVYAAEQQLELLNIWLNEQRLPLLSFDFLQHGRWSKNNPFIQEQIPWDFEGEFLAWHAGRRHIVDHPNGMYDDLAEWRFVALTREIAELWGGQPFHSRARGKMGGVTQSETPGYKILKKYVPHTEEERYVSGWAHAYSYTLCTPTKRG